MTMINDVFMGVIPYRGSQTSVPDHQYCSACRKKILISDPNWGFFLSLKITNIEKPGTEAAKNIENSFSPYNAYQDYHICFGCLLRALRIKPPKKEKTCSEEKKS